MEKRKPPNDMYEFYRLGMDILENSRARIASISTTLGQGSSIERGRGKAGRRTRELKGENKVAALPSPTYLRPPKRGLRVGGSGYAQAGLRFSPTSLPVPFHTWNGDAAKKEWKILPKK